MVFKNNISVIEAPKIRIPPLRTVTAHKDVTELEKTFSKGQEEWNFSDNGKWTYKLIKNVKQWVHWRHGSTDFHLKQMLKRRGCFGYYLNKYKKGNNPKCIGCKYISDDVDHTLIQRKVVEQKRELEIQLGNSIEPETLFESMLKKKGKVETSQDVLTPSTRNQRGKREEKSEKNGHNVIISLRYLLKSKPRE